MILFFLFLSHFSSFHAHTDFLTPEIGKRWRLGINALSYYSQSEMDDSLDYFLSEGALLEWKINSFMRTSGGFFLENTEKKSSASPLFNFVAGGPGGAFTDLGASFSVSNNGFSASLLADVQRNKICGFLFSPGYFWGDSTSFPYLSSRFYFTQTSNRSYVEIEKQFGKDSPFFSFDNSFVKFGILTEFFGNFSLEILTSVRLGSQFPASCPDWTLGAKIFAGLIRDPSSVRGSGTLAGTVKSEGGEPVRNAVVSLVSDSPVEIFTDSSGFFNFTDVPSGFVTLNVVSEGFRALSMPVSVRKNQNVFLELTLDQSVESILYDLSVYDYFTGQPVLSHIRGRDLSFSFTDTSVSANENETLYIESDNYLTAAVAPQKTTSVRVPILPVNGRFIFETQDFEDSTLSSSGMMRLMELKFLLDFYPNSALTFEGRDDFSEIIRNSLFTFFSLNNDVEIIALPGDSTLEITFDDVYER
ncbi:carboxypeptidase regulatory-like domain-containing protein [candidate division WOR-3 bacterium]|nr:carboxypeptidase regulatory-like domain-containing protein [candidate division WOR-3 bacterium]